MHVVSVRDEPSYTEIAIAYFQEKWPDVDPIIYEDCIMHAIDAKDNLPQWYLLQDDTTIIGCAGLITNDFISRGDLYPWLCALYVDDAYRGHFHSTLLIEKAKADTRTFGYSNLYLSTAHVGLYEKLGFTYIGDGYHPWGASSRIYAIAV